MDQEERPEVRRLRQHLLSEESSDFRGALTDLHLSWDLAAVTGQLPDLGDLAEAARLVGDGLRQQLDQASTEDWLGPKEWAGPEQTITLGALTYRGRAAELMALGGFLLATGVEDPDRFVNDLTQVAFGLDPYSAILGTLVGNRPLEFDPPELPPELVGIRDFLDATCVAGIRSSASHFGQVAAQRPRPMAGVTIDEVDPDRGCAGDTVVIRGTGFGQTQPSNVQVLFTSRSGGCVAADVTSWSDTEIVVTVPPSVGRGCVGLAEYPSGYTGIAEAADEFAGALESCLGPVASTAANRIRGSAVKVMGASCPICTDPRTAFAGGAPVIKRFAANGDAVAEIVPGDDVSVIWEVEGADKVDIVPVLGVLPTLRGPFDRQLGSVVVEDIALDDGTVAAWRLVATNACGAVTATVQVVVRGRKALVLGVGGAKGAFEVGAVLCLYNVAGLQPEIISGASVGALNAAKLAEGRPALPQLEQLWLGMQSNSDLYLERSWYQVLSPVVRSVFQAGSSSLGFEAARFGANLAANKILGSLLSAMGVPGIVFSVFTGLYPVITGIIDAGRYYNAVTQALASPSIFLFTPVEQKINTSIDPAAVLASGIKLRITAVALESGRARVFNEQGVMLESGFRSPLRDVIRASASIPIAFPPVMLIGPNGWEQYIDGGVRENVPLQAAVDAGAHRVYAVLPNPLSVDFTTAFSPPRMINIAGRTVDLVLHEAQQNDMFPYRGFGIPVTPIAPTFLVNDTLLVDPGLIRINMDYGYMRAYDDVVADPTERATMRRLSDQITAARVDAWSLEHQANGERLPGSPHVQSGLVPVPDPVALQAARGVKRTIRALAYNRIAADPRSVPAHRAAWWQEWERHPWPPLIPSPWGLFISRLGQLAAEPVPPA